MFGKKKHNEAVSAKAPTLVEKPTPVEEKPTPFDIGKDGTVEEFRAANKQAVEHTTKQESRDTKGEFVKHLGAADQKALREGAIQAFLGGRSENLQMVMQDPAEFGIRDSWARGILADLAAKEYNNVRETILSEVIKRSNDLPADIQRLLEIFPQQGAQVAAQEILDYALRQVVSVSGKENVVENLSQLALKVAVSGEDVQKTAHDILIYTLRQVASISPAKEDMAQVFVNFASKADIGPQVLQECLDRALYDVVANNEREEAVAALLDLGADANAALNDDGYKGRILAKAVINEMPPAVIALLSKKGANFADALYLMRSKPGENWTSGAQVSLKTHAKKITGKLLERAGDRSVLEQELAETRDELTKTKKELEDTGSKLSSDESEVRRAKSKISSLESRARLASIYGHSAY